MSFPRACRVMLTFVGVAILGEAAIQAALLLLALPDDLRAASTDGMAELLWQVLDGVWRSAALVGLATYWWSAGYAAIEGRSHVPEGGSGLSTESEPVRGANTSARDAKTSAREAYPPAGSPHASLQGGLPRLLLRAVAYTGLFELISRAVGLAWTPWVSAPLQAWMLADGFTPSQAQAFTDPFNTLAQTAIIVGSSLLAAKVVLRVPQSAPDSRDGGVDLSHPVMTARARPARERSHAAASRAALGIQPGMRTARGIQPATSGAPWTFVASLMLLHGLGAAATLHIVALPLLLLVPSTTAAIAGALLLIGLFAYVCCRRNESPEGPHDARLGLAMFSAFFWLQVATLLAVTMVRVAIELAARGPESFLPFAVVLGAVYPLAVYPACRMALRRGRRGERTVTP